MSEPSRCGPHAQLASNEHVRVSQCPCGTYHVSLVKRGISLQLGVADVKAIAEAFGVAVRVADAEERGRCLTGAPGTAAN